MRYECTPGRHLFWGRSENRDFIEADLEAGKIYFIEAVPQMGALKASLNLKAINPDADAKAMKRILKVIRKKKDKSSSEEDQASETEDLGEVIKRGLERYQEVKNKNKKLDQLPANWYYKG
ncbi:hypothetical protein [Ferruginibacter sp.]